MTMILITVACSAASSQWKHLAFRKAVRVNDFTSKLRWVP